MDLIQGFQPNHHVINDDVDDAFSDIDFFELEKKGLCFAKSVETPEQLSAMDFILAAAVVERTIIRGLPHPLTLF
jgi:hypothetical protein